MLRSERYLDEKMCQMVIDGYRELLGKAKPLYGNNMKTVRKNYLRLQEKEKHRPTKEQLELSKQRQEKKKASRRSWWAKHKNDPEFVKRQRDLNKEKMKNYRAKEKKVREELDNEKESKKEIAA